MGVDSPYGGADPGDEHRDRPPERHSGETHGQPVKFETRSREECAFDLRLAVQRQALDGRRSNAPAAERPEWQAALARGEVDRVGLGIVDERARAFLPKERRIASLLAEAGAAVVAVHDGYGAEGRKPDALVDDTYTEFKSLDPGASNKTVRSALKDAKGQAAHAVIDARDSGLSQDEAERGMRRFLGTPYAHRLDAIRIVGDDFDIDWRQG
jgi:contact-dependent growth inhibition (CDI) system CdiA-like toxin